LPVKEIAVSVEIQAPAARVWQVLTEFASYPQWLPSVHRASGPVETGGCLEISAGTSEAPPRTARMRLSKVERERELCWTNTSGFIFFKSERRFKIEPLSQDRVRLVQAEVFGSPIAAFLDRVLDHVLFGGMTRGANAEMSQLIKARAELLERQTMGGYGDETVWPPPPARPT